jgi:hypothetical protein
MQYHILILNKISKLYTIKIINHKNIIKKQTKQ